MVWLGVAHSFQQQLVGSVLYREMEERMRRQDVRMMIIDTAASNAQALKFFNNMGFAKPRRQIWLSKVLKKTRKNQA